ncbi:MAG: hypothetical protein FWE42_05785 [Defluviitaleaceae bacterium]|nr:hypothetical protein [Defluviitaleaceae bacterium]
MDQFTYVKRGYDPEEVDKYISTLEQVIKSYKDKDNAIKNAIISAQVAADNVVRNAQMHADAYKVQISEQLVEMRATLDRQRMSLQAFQESYANMVRRCIQELEQSSMADLFTRLEEMETAISDLQGLEAMSGAPDRQTPGIPAGNRPDYQSQDLPRDRDYLRDNAYDAPRPSREYDTPPRDDYRDTSPYAGQDMREASREDIRDVMRNPARDIMQRPAAHETLFDTPPQREPAYQPDRDDRPDQMQQMQQTRSQTRHPDMYSPDRDMRGQDMHTQTHHDYGAERDMPRNQNPQPSYESNMYQDQAHGYTEPAPREQMREWDREYTQPRDMRDPSRDMRRDPRLDAGRDIRDPGRDVRRDPARDMMRPPERDGMRPDNREPMRDMNRPPYMPESDNYGDNDQNLLPPVASLM